MNRGSEFGSVDLVQVLVHNKGVMKVNTHQAKTHLSELLRHVAGGEEVTIARAGVPIARLVAVEKKVTQRPLGLDRGRFEVPEDFDAPLPPDLLATFYGKPSRGTRRAIKRTRRRQR